MDERTHVRDVTPESLGWTPHWSPDWTPHPCIERAWIKPDGTLYVFPPHGPQRVPILEGDGHG